MTNKTPWTPGQQVALNRARIVTIERVTPSGRAVVEGVYYDARGYKIGHKSIRWNAWPKIELLTKDVEDVLYRRQIRKELSAAVELLDQFFRNKFNHHRMQPTPEQLATAERLTAAINAVLGEK